MNTPSSELIQDARRRILTQVQASMVRRRRTRKAVRAGVAVGGLALVSVGVWLASRPTPVTSTGGTSAPMVAEAPVAPAISAHAVAAIPDRVPVIAPAFTSLTLIESPTSLAVVQLVSDATPSEHVRLVGDEELLAALTRSGHDVGIMRYPTGEALIVCNSCEDDSDWLSPIDGPTGPIRQ